jgi:hypothetical protein
MIHIKDEDVLLELLEHEFHPKIGDVLRWMESLYPGRMTITSGFRPGVGVHGTDPCRGVDLRSHNYSAPQKICDHINQVWEYDPARPHMMVCVLHDTGQGIHFHIQVHPTTRLRDERV